MTPSYQPIPLSDEKLGTAGLPNGIAPGPNSYVQHSFPPPASAPSPARTPSLPPGLTATFKSYSARLELLIAAISDPLKPHLNKLGRFLLVSTFLEDALRIANQFHDQMHYLTDVRRFPKSFAIGFLIANLALMVLCSLLIIVKRWSHLSFPGLVVVIVSQGVVYDLYTDGTFICLNLSVLGALMLGLSDTLHAPGAKRVAAGLPDVSEDSVKKRQTYLQLAGRILLVVFFVGHAVVAWVNIVDEFSVAHLVAVFFAVLACLLVTIGFKARWSALFLVIISSIVNVMANDWWSKPKDHPERDFRRFDFFQALSVVGGMILLINQGPGGMSFDAKRKDV